MPSVTGFRPAAFPPSQPAGGQETGAHVIESFNCSGGKNTLKKRLRATRALVVIVKSSGMFQTRSKLFRAGRKHVVGV